MSQLKQDKNNFTNVWLFKYTPEYIIAKTNLYNSYNIYSKYRNCDIGVDLVAIKDDIVYFIQCKNYDNVISVDDLASFYFLIHEFELNGLVYYNGKLSERINDLSMGKVPFINMPFNNQLIEHQMFNLDKTIITPREYQLDAFNKLKNEHRSVLNLPCGMGKTYTAYMIGKLYNNIIIISPTRSLAENSLDKLYEYSNKQYEPLLISMDGSRDVIQINKLIKNKNIISVTYDSVDILNKIIGELNNIFIIIDEYHNLSDIIRRFYIDLEKLLITYKDNIVRDLSDQLGIKKSNNALIQQNKQKGMIYVLKIDDSDEDDKFEAKIGKTEDLEKRMKQYNVGHVYELPIIFAYLTDDIDEIEKCLKMCLQQYQIKNETYVIDKQLIRDTIKYCKARNSILLKYDRKILKSKDNYRMAIIIDSQHPEWAEQFMRPNKPIKKVAKRKTSKPKTSKKRKVAKQKPKDI